MDADSVASRRAGHVRWWGPVAGALLGAAILTLLVRSVGAGDLAQVAADLGAGTLAVVVVLELLALAALIQVYRATFGLGGGRLGYRDGAAVGLGAVCFTQLLPGGGVAGGIYAARRLIRAGADPVAASGTVIIVGLVTMGTLGALVTTATAVGAVVSPGYGSYAIAAGLLTLTAFVLLVGLLKLLADPRARARLAAWLGARRGGRGVLAGVAADLRRQEGLLGRPRRLARPASWAAVKWVCDLAVLGLFVTAAGVSIAPLAVVVSYAVANLLNGLPLTPGGLGVVELGATGTLVVFGADPVAASVAVLGYRAVAVGVPVLSAGLASGMPRLTAAVVR